MIEFQQVSFCYQSTERKSGVYGLDLTIPDGQVVLLCGESGCGKTTVTRLVNGLAPGYYSGELTGTVLVNGKDASRTPLPELSRTVGSVFQDPRSQFFTVETTGEIAFGCENQGLPKDEIFRRIGAVSQQLNIRSLLDRSLFALSGGEKQKIACASVAAMEPQVLVLDEPSSNLDIATIADLRKILARWKAMGKTILIAEHRLAYLMGIADRVLYLKDGRLDRDMTAAQFAALSPEQLHAMGLRSLHLQLQAPDRAGSSGSGETLRLRDFRFSYGRRQILDIRDCTVPQGAVIGVLGNNGAGKSTFAKCLCGLSKAAEGSLTMGGETLDRKQRLQRCYMVMQDVNHQLFTESVEEEILLSLPGENPEADSALTGRILAQLNLSAFRTLHPLSLSGGQKQRVAIGSAIASGKELLVFDEPTSGLDHRHMLEVADTLRTLTAMGKTIFVITHDPELLWESCDSFLFLERGSVLWSGGWSPENLRRLSAFFANR